MINRLFQLTCVLLLAILILRILGKSEKPAVDWASQRISGSIAKTSGKPAQQPKSSLAATSSYQSTRVAPQPQSAPVDDWATQLTPAAHQPQSSPVAASSTQISPAAHRAECPAGTKRTDSIYLGEALALQFKKQSSAFKTIAQIENQLGQPNCKGTNKAVWMTSDGKAIRTTQQPGKVNITFSGF